jgi:outer membrane biosynthesis protein TonB
MCIRFMEKMGFKEEDFPVYWDKQTMEAIEEQKKRKREERRKKKMKNSPDSSPSPPPTKKKKVGKKGNKNSDMSAAVSAKSSSSSSSSSSSKLYKIYIFMEKALEATAVKQLDGVKKNINAKLHLRSPQETRIDYVILCDFQVCIY